MGATSDIALSITTEQVETVAAERKASAGGSSWNEREASAIPFGPKANSLPPRAPVLPLSQRKIP